MTDHDLSTMLQEHIRSDEHPFFMNPDTTIALGRRTLRRRRARRTGMGMLVVAASVTTVLSLVHSGGTADTGRELDPATAHALENSDTKTDSVASDEVPASTVNDAMLNCMGLQGWEGKMNLDGTMTWASSPPEQKSQFDSQFDLNPPGESGDFLV